MPETLEIPGLNIWTTPPTSYQMGPYIDGWHTYTDPFVMINCSAEWVATAGSAIAPVMAQLEAALAAIPLVGEAIAAIVGFGAMWYASASLNDDGSVTLEFAQHYCGTKAGGVDITTWPMPGVNPDVWQGILQKLMQGAGDDALSQTLRTPLPIKPTVKSNAPHKREPKHLDAEYQLLFSARFLASLQTAFNNVVNGGGQNEYDGTPTVEFDEMIQEGFNEACRANGGVQHVEQGLIPAYVAAANGNPSATINVVTQVDDGDVPYVTVNGQPLGDQLTGAAR